VRASPALAEALFGAGYGRLDVAPLRIFWSAAQPVASQQRQVEANLISQLATHLPGGITSMANNTVHT
jgi:hypothetical protein